MNVAYNQGRLVYHYTRMDAFLNIIEEMHDGKLYLRASNMHGLNDASEYIYGVKQLRRILPAIERKIQDEGYKIDNHLLISKALDEDEKKYSYAFDERFADFMLKGITSPYVISTSSMGDSIPMWSMYGDAGKGVAIGIDVANCIVENKTHNEVLMVLNDGPQAFKLVNTLSLEHPAAIVGKGDYIDYLNKAKDMTNPIEIEKLMITTFGKMASYTAPLLKHPAFNYENEWRLLVFEQKVGDVNYGVNRKGNLTSYIKLSLPTEKMRKLIIGPCCNGPYQQEIIRKLLYDKGICHCKVTKSKVSLR